MYIYVEYICICKYTRMYMYVHMYIYMYLIYIFIYRDHQRFSGPVKAYSNPSLS